MRYKLRMQFQQHLKDTGKLQKKIPISNLTYTTMTNLIII